MVAALLPPLDSPAAAFLLCVAVAIFCAGVLVGMLTSKKLDDLDFDEAVKKEARRITQRKP